MKHQNLLGLLIFVFSWALAPFAAAATVDFQSFSNNNAIITTPTDVQGLTFASNHFHIPNFDSGSFGGMVTPFNYLAVDGPGLGFPVSVTLTGGG